jgi:hypothetical protein
VPPHFVIASDPLPAFFIVLSNSVLQLSTGDFEWPRLSLVWNIFFDLIITSLPCSLPSIKTQRNTCFPSFERQSSIECLSRKIHINNNDRIQRQNTKTEYQCECSSTIMFKEANIEIEKMMFRTDRKCPTQDDPEIIVSIQHDSSLQQQHTIRSNSETKRQDNMTTTRIKFLFSNNKVSMKNNV